MNKTFFKNQLHLRPALLIFCCIFIMTGLNAIFNSIAFSLGYGYPYASFLFDPSDRFADYFKGIFSLPGASDLQIGGSSLLRGYLDNNPYGGVKALTDGTLTNLHGTPLVTLIALLNLKLMHFISPWYVFCAIFFSGAVLIYALVKKIARSTLDSVLLFASLLLCYPTLFMVTRGHIYSGMTALALSIFLLCAYQNKKRFLAILLLAIAVNLKPNAIIFILALGLPGLKNIKMDVFVFTCLAACIGATSYLLANATLPDYTPENWLKAVSIYHDIYVVHNAGLAYGSSLFGPLKSLFGYGKFIEIVPLVLACLIIIFGTIQFHTNKISKSSYIFILCASYVYGSAVFADYHLLILFTPLICLYMESGISPLNTHRPIFFSDLNIIFVSSVLLLSPKCYMYKGNISDQVLLNPLILVTACFFITACRRPISKIGTERKTML